MPLDLFRLGPEWGPISIGPYLRTQFSWVQHQDSFQLGSASGSISIGSCLRIQFYWVLPRDQIEMVLRQDPRFLVLRFLNIIICVINIVVVVIIIIICKIINKFKKKLLSILKINLRFDLKGKTKNYCYCYYH